MIIEPKQEGLRLPRDYQIVDNWTMAPRDSDAYFSGIPFDRKTVGAPIEAVQTMPVQELEPVKPVVRDVAARSMGQTCELPDDVLNYMDGIPGRQFSSTRQ